MNALMIDRVTLTGPDDSTDPEALASLAGSRPWLEFAVLLSLTQQGHERYPSTAWRHRFYQSTLPRSQRALHLCGRVVLQLLDGTIASSHVAEVEAVSRVQLNFSARQFTPDALDSLSARLLAWCDRIPDLRFIIQYNDDNAGLTEVLRREPCLVERVSFLADASGGRGIAPQQWPAPLPPFRTDYAGGIGPGRITEVLATLAQVTPRAGIDMESSLRTDGRFDLAKVRAVLAEIEERCTPSTQGPDRGRILHFNASDLRL